MPDFIDDPVVSRTSNSTHAIVGESVGGRGLVGRSDADYGIRGHSKRSAGIRGSSELGRGVEGWGGTQGEGVWATNESGGDAIWGQAKVKGTGVKGTSDAGVAVKGVSPNGRGVEGWSDTQYGVAGESKTSAGVRGTSTESRGVEGWSTNSEGVVGISKTGNAVWGQTEGAGVGVLGTSKSGAGVWGQADGAGPGVRGISQSGVGVFGKGGRLAGFFQGDVEVTGDIRLVQADCAEDFDIEEAVDPGTVMVLGEEGVLRQSHQAYDKRVAGVISGAGNYRPGIILDKQESQTKRLPVGLLGKVYCKVDAQSSPIEIGDLLTTSHTPGHAMKATDPLKAFGAVIGKALRPLKEGQGLIPILVALQ